MSYLLRPAFGFSRPSGPRRGQAPRPAPALRNIALRKPPTKDPTNDTEYPSAPAMTTSIGHRLWDVGSAPVSYTTRAMTVQGTDAPTTRNADPKRAAATQRHPAAATKTTTRPTPHNEFGSDALLYGIRQ